MIYEDRGSERKRKERKHLQREIKMCFAAASYVEFEYFCFYIFTFAFHRLYLALFLSTFLVGCGFRRPSSRRRRRCDDIRASPRIFPKPPPLDNEQSFRRALFAGLFCLSCFRYRWVCFSSPPPPPHYPPPPPPLPLHLSIRSLQRWAVIFAFFPCEDSV